MNVYQKLQAARIKLQSTKLNKSGHNKFAGYQYFELGDFLPTIQTIFNELGLCGSVSFTPELAFLHIVNCDKPEETIVFSSPMSEANLKGCHPIQNLGAVETYQRRYLWVTAMEIVEHDALDATTGSETANGIKRGKGVIKPTDGALEALSPEDQDFARGEASYIQCSFNDGNAQNAYEEWCTIADNDMKVAIWSLLDSKVRSALKKMKQEEPTVEHA